MSDFYSIKSQEASPLKRSEASSFMKVTSTSENDLIQSIIDAATQWGENYTGRDFRVKDWVLLTDSFANRINLNRSQIESITSVKHLVSTVLTTVSDSVYYLKKLTQCSEILLVDGQEWPTDTDEREQAIEIEFKTLGYDCNSEIIEALKRHVAFLYTNRGDCPDVSKAAMQSGATFIYDQFRIPRV